VIAGERADEPVRELSAEHDLEALARLRPRLGETSYTGTVIQQAADGLAVGGRRGVHGSVVIGPPSGRENPWRE
jgi:hypothetical protein